MKKRHGAIGMNILLFIGIAACLLYMVGWGTTFSDIFTFFGMTPANGQVSNGTLLLAFGGLLTVGAIIVGTFSFPNPYAIFAPIAVVLGAIVVGTWGNFFTAAQFPVMDIPLDTGVVIPAVPVVTLVVGGILAILGGLSLIAFLKGGEF